MKYEDGLSRFAQKGCIDTVIDMCDNDMGKAKTAIKALFELEELEWVNSVTLTWLERNYERFVAPAIARDKRRKKAKAASIDWEDERGGESTVTIRKPL